MQRLRAGDLTLFFDPETASLRYLKAGGAEVLRGVYAAVRDGNWGTVPFTLENVELEHHEDSFRLAFDSVHRQEDIHFVWHGRVEGKENRLEFSFDGEAKTDFKRNRIGFCVLHPLSAAGAACVLEHTNGSREKGRFPERIAAHEPFGDLRAIEHELAPGLWAVVTLTGETFDMEDQRNWTDASFKTYCTPLAEPFPVAVSVGDRVQQRMSVRLEGTLPATVENETNTFTLLDERKNVPRLGVGAGDAPLSGKVLERLKTLNLDHLRVDVQLGADYAAKLRQKVAEADVLGVGLELALHTGTGDLEAFAEAFSDLSVHRFLIFRKNGKSTSARTLERARRALAPSYPDTPLFGGTDAFFAELNREPPPVGAHDGLVYSLNPQVHAFDDASLMETLPAQAETVASAVYLAGGKPVAVSPITFKMRHNPNAMGEPCLSLAAQTDPRQHGPFGAAWTLASLKHLTLSAASSLTYFEAAGPLGLMDADGEPYPLFDVFREVGALKDAVVVGSISSHPLEVEGLALAHGTDEQLLLANLTAQPQVVWVERLAHLGRRGLNGVQDTPVSGEAPNRVMLEPFEVTVLKGAL